MTLNIAEAEDMEALPTDSNKLLLKMQPLLALKLRHIQQMDKQAKFKSHGSVMVTKTQFGVKEKLILKMDMQQLLICLRKANNERI